MIKPHNRANSCCNYMLALSVTDNLMMLVAVYLWYLTCGFFRDMAAWECKLMAVLFNPCSYIGIYLIVFMTLDRFIAVCFPLKSSILCTPKRARRCILCVVVCVSVYTAPYVYTSGLINGKLCAGITSNALFPTIYSWSTTVIFSLLPFLLLLTMNCVIINRILTRSRKKKKMVSSSNSKDKGRTTDSQLTIMLLLITFAFLVLTLPLCIRYLLTITIDYNNDPYYNAVYTFVYHLSQKLFVTNNAVNFYFYCIGGAKFRADLAQVCGRNKRAQKQQTRRSERFDSITSTTEVWARFESITSTTEVWMILYDVDLLWRHCEDVRSALWIMEYTVTRTDSLLGKLQGLLIGMWLAISFEFQFCRSTCVTSAKMNASLYLRILRMQYLISFLSLI